MAKEKNIWMPLFIGDYMKSTNRLNTEQHGAYMLLIMDYWANGVLPDDDGVLSNITKLGETKWKKHRATLARYFVIESGYWKHTRIESELEKSRLRQLASAENGKKGGRPRKKLTSNVVGIGT